MVDLGIWDECQTLRQVMVCRPTTNLPEDKTAIKHHAFLSMTHPEKMLAQHADLCDILTKHKVHVLDLMDRLHHFDFVHLENYPNRIFMRDMGVTLKNTLFMGRAGLTSRQREFHAVQSLVSKLFPHMSHETLFEEFEHLECGDFFILSPCKLLLNINNRTVLKNKKLFLSKMKDFGFKEIILIKIPKNFGMIHLDLGFNVLKRRGVLVREKLLALPVLWYHQGKEEKLTLFDFLKKSKISVVGINEPLYQKNKFLTNYIFLDPETILCNQHTAELLESEKYPIHTVKADLDELEKAGGSVRCLTLPLKRDKNT